MINIPKETKQMIQTLMKKGDPIVELGPTQAGKSSFITETASSLSVKNLLSLREAQGKGSLMETSVIITNYKELNPDVLYVMGNFKKYTKASAGDDSEFLSNVLYSPVKIYCERDPDYNRFQQSIRDNLREEIDNAPNNSLAHKLKNVPAQDLEDLARIIDCSYNDDLKKTLARFPEFMAEVKAEYEQMFRSQSRPKAEKMIFREILNSSNELGMYKDLYLDRIVRFLDDEIQRVKDMLGKESLLPDGRFLVGLSSDDLDSNRELCDTLLDSESGSSEFLFGTLSLLFKGDGFAFPFDSESPFMVLSSGDDEIQCIRIVDTMGMLHSTSEVTEEASRVMDIMRSNNTNNLLLFLNSHISATEKSALEVARDVLSSITVKTNVYVFFTHMDDCLAQKASLERFGKRRFDADNRTAVDWEKIYINVVSDQENLVRDIQIWLNMYKNNKSVVAGVYRAGFVNQGLEHQEVLKSHNITYEHAIDRFVTDVLKYARMNKTKIRVGQGIPKYCHVFSSEKTFNIQMLYRNLALECKGRDVIKYWPQTVKAVNRKWLVYAIPHESDVQSNPYGYQNINSVFVREIRNLARHILKNGDMVKIGTGDLLLNDADPEEFKKAVLDYLDENQNFGRWVAKKLGYDAYINGFAEDLYEKPLYLRLRDMLQYTQDHYFWSENIALTDEMSHRLLLMLNLALQECVEEYIDKYCVEVMTK